MRIGKEATNKIQTRDHEVSNDSRHREREMHCRAVQVKNECSLRSGCGVGWSGGS